MNNLFLFATSELSQDAFICYLLNWFNETGDQHAELRQMARHIIHDISGVPEGEIEQVSIFRQLSKKVVTSEPPKTIIVKIDVLVIVNQTLALIIEDKTNTTLHDDQIARYRKGLEELSKDSGNDSFCKIISIKTAYWKTGYWYDYDKVVIADKHVNREIVKRYLHLYTSKNSIIDEYYRYLLSLDEEEEIKKQECWTKAGLQNYRISQQALMRFFFPEKLWKKMPNKQYELYEVYHDANRNGSPWTQMAIKYIGDEESCTNNSIFWRIDSECVRRNGEYAPYIALRLYAEKHYEHTEDGIKAIKWKCDDVAQKAHKDYYERIIEGLRRGLQTEYSDLITFKNPNPGDRESTLFYIYLTESRLREYQNKKNEFAKTIKEINEKALKIMEEALEDTPTPLSKP